MVTKCSTGAVRRLTAEHIWNYLPAMQCVVVVYPSYVIRVVNADEKRREEISQSDVIAWAALNDITLMVLNPAGSGDYLIYAMTPVTPEQEMAIRLRWH